MARPAIPTPIETLRAVLGSPRLSSALATAAIGTAVLAFALRQLIGWAGLNGILATLVALCLASLWAQWQEVGWRGLLPVSLLAYLVWAGLSLVWSGYQWATVGGLAYLLAFTILGVYVALVRDTIQIVRVFGDVLRVVLVASLAIEIVAGVLLDGPIRFLDIAGHLDQFGPIQGLLGTRNQLGIVAVIALVTFGTEWRTRSIPRGLALGSVILAALTVLLTRSPVALGALAVLLPAAAALYGVRRVRPERRRFWQLAILGLAVVGAIIAWTLRSSIIGALNATGELNYRLALWRQIWSLVSLNPLEGWGWIGIWRTEIVPFTSFEAFTTRVPTSALLAPLDVWLQLGLVGVAILIGMLGLTFTRSWLLAARRRSVVFAWPALVLVVLLVSSLAESMILVEFGWLTFVVCCVKASRELSWRRAFAEPLSAPLS
jgi:O-antigen ligase